MNVLLLYDIQPQIAQTIRDHVEALASCPEAVVYPLPVLGDLPRALDLNRFDAIIIHYSLCVSSDYFLSSSARQRLGKSSPVKAVFIQDEHRHVDRTIEALKELGCSLIFTCCRVPERVYGNSFRFYPVLTGYVPHRLLGRPSRPLYRRPIDIGYRGRSLPEELGKLAQDKRIIGETFAVAAREARLRADISTREEDRLYGSRWVRFIENCKAMLGTESGAENFEFGDRRELLPMAQISPRCFEAAALRTPMVLYEGEYSGILQPWRHYLPVAKDHSNLDHVLDTIKNNHARLECLASNAYTDIADNPRFSFKFHADQVFKEIRRVVGHCCAPGYDWEYFGCDTNPPLSTMARWATRRIINSSPFRLVHPLVRDIHLSLPGTNWRRRFLGYPVGSAGTLGGDRCHPD